MPKVVLINSGYRPGGVTDQLLDEIAAQFAKQGFESSHRKLREMNLKFCTNCRGCMQEPGPKRGRCVLEDDADRILDEFDAADWLVLGSPVNFFTITAIMKLFQERMVGYAWWPWGQAGPKFRNEKPRGRAILVTSSAMPAPLAFFFTKAVKAMRSMAKLAGFKPVKVYRVGMVAQEPQWRMPEKLREKIARDLGKLARS